MEKHPLHLKNPELQTSPEVNRAVKRKEKRTDEKMPNDPAERIEAYMDRLENIFLNPDEKKRDRNIEMFRDQIYDALIIKPEKFPESYFDLQKRIARERGQEVQEISEDVRERMIATAIEDQRHSLDAWIDYLTSPDAVYPAWFKYFVWKNIIKLSQFDKERREFKKRTDSTVAPYPDIYREPLAQIADLYEKVKADNKILKDEEVKEAFSKKFPALYAELISKSLAASMEGREQIKGQWVRYMQGQEGEAEKLYTSLENKGTGWCTAGHSTAEAQIESGDFYVYYTYDADQKPTQPRLAIRMDGNQKIGEVRGILPHQGVEPIMQDVLEAKLGEFGAEAETYKKKSKDMRMLTALEKKHEQEEDFTKDDLLFLYETNFKIEGFGYGRDPRIAELRKGRNLGEDILVVFDCTKAEIAHVPNEINANTKAYVGPLEPGVLQKLGENFEHVYTSFPDKKIKREEVEIGGKDAKQLTQELQSMSNIISDYSGDMMRNRDFVVGKTRENITLIRLTVADLGFNSMATTDQIYARAQELGLELCPPDTGPNYRIKYQDQPMNEWVYIGMKQIADRDGYPGVFRLGRDADGLWLYHTWAKPGHGWDPNREFVFRLRPPEAGKQVESQKLSSLRNFLKF